MFIKILRYLKYLKCMQRVNLAMARGAATSAMRRIDSHDPKTWEFSGFSQNGEDGIIEYLGRSIKDPNRYFVEIGSSNGLENNTTWLALVERYSGLMIEGDSDASSWCKYWLGQLCVGVEYHSFFINKDNATDLKKIALYWNPDVFSLDIDGNDYYIMQALLEVGFRPKIVVVEYNSVFGPDRSISIKYASDFMKKEDYGVNLYFGCSIAAWQKLFRQYKYEFVSVDQNGINAFFIDPESMNSTYVAPTKRLDFKPSISHAREYKISWDKQFEFIKNMLFTDL